jgi:hypothetical protein
LIDDQGSGLGLEGDGDVAFGVARSRRWCVPDTDVDSGWDVGLEAVEVQVVAVAGHHLLPCGVHGGCVVEVGVGVIHLDESVAWDGVDAVFGQEPHEQRPFSQQVIFT